MIKEENNFIDKTERSGYTGLSRTLKEIFSFYILTYYIE